MTKGKKMTISKQCSRIAALLNQLREIGYTTMQRHDLTFGLTIEESIKAAEMELAKSGHQIMETN